MICVAPLLLSPLLFPCGPHLGTGRSVHSDVDPALRAAAQEIQAQVEEIRGLKFKVPVTLKVASEQDLKEYLAAMIAEETTPEELEALDLVFKLTGLLPVDQNLLATQLELIESQVGGFYDPKTDTFSLMESLVGSGLAKIILAHELTHALDDQHFDLDGGMQARKDNADALWAYQSVVEGSATAVMNKWTLRMMMDKDNALSQEDLEQAADMGADVLERMQPFLWKPMLGAYLRGSSFLVRTESVLKATMSMPSVEDLNRAFEAPPLSSEQILHPEAYWETVDAPRAVDLEFDLAADGLGQPLEMLAQDTFGELLLACLVEAPAKRKGLKGQMAVLSAVYSSEATKGWGGDRWALLGQGDRRVLVLRSVWDSAVEAEEFVAALASKDLDLHFRAALLGLAKNRGLKAQDVHFRHALQGEEVIALWAVGASDAVVDTLLGQVAPR